METLNEYTTCLCDNYKTGYWDNEEFVYFDPITLKRKKELAKDSCELHGEPR